MTIDRVHHGLRGPIAALMVLAPALFLFACTGNDSVYTGHFFAFGGQVDITIVGVHEREARAAVNAVERDFAYMEKAWNPNRAGALARTNKLLATGETFTAPPSVLPLLERARQFEALTGGLVNPALGKVHSLWVFDDHPSNPFRPPDNAAVDDLMARKPSLADIENDDFRLRSRNSAVMLDFDSFLKGYAVDQAIHRLLELGVDNALINVGGDLRAIGSRAGHPWNVPIRRSDGTGVFATLDVRGDESLATVGQFENYRDHDGTRYHHILDPRTGHPSKGAKSVTVVYRDAATAQAAATALFIAGPDGWVEVAAKTGLRQAMLIDNNDTLHITPELHQRLRILGDAPPMELRQPQDSAEMR